MDIYVYTRYHNVYVFSVSTVYPHLYHYLHTGLKRPLRISLLGDPTILLLMVQKSCDHQLRWIVLTHYLQSLITTSFRWLNHSRISEPTPQTPPKTNECPPKKRDIKGLYISIGNSESTQESTQGVFLRFPSFFRVFLRFCWADLQPKVLQNQVISQEVEMAELVGTQSASQNSTERCRRLGRLGRVWGGCCFLGSCFH